MVRVSQTTMFWSPLYSPQQPLTPQTSQTGFSHDYHSGAWTQTCAPKSQPQPFILARTCRARGALYIVRLLPTCRWNEALFHNSLNFASLNGCQNIEFFGSMLSFGHNFYRKYRVLTLIFYNNIEFWPLFCQFLEFVPLIQYASGTKVAISDQVPPPRDMIPVALRPTNLSQSVSLPTNE